MERIEIFANLATRTLTDQDGGTLNLPKFYPGKYLFQLKLLDLDADGALVQARPIVRALSAFMGRVQAPSEGGDFKLKFGSGGTASGKIAFDADAEAFKAILAALPLATTYALEEVYEVAQGVWMARFANAVLQQLQVADNMLQPETFVRVREMSHNGRIWHEIKLLQAPLAASADFDKVLAAPPNMRRIRAGVTIVSGIEVVKINEIQALEVPAEYVGTFALKFSGQHTRVLSATDGIDTISVALNDLYKVPIGNRFVVTNPELHNAYIEFVGAFSGLPQPLLEVEITNPGEGELNFELNLDTAEMAAALRSGKDVTAIFEVQIEVVDIDGNTDDPGLPSRRVVLFQQEVAITRELGWDGLAAAAPIDWLTPPAPKDYLPFSRDQVITGNQHYTIIIGDAVHADFTIQHDLNTKFLVIEVWENAETARRLRDDEFTAVRASDNAITVTFPAPPTEAQYAVTISSAGPKSAFVSHTHVIGNVIGLQDALDTLGSRVAALENLLPEQIQASPNTFINPFGDENAASAIVFIKLAEKVELVPLSRALQGIDLKTVAKGTVPDNLPKAGALVPAIHVADPADIIVGVPSPLPSAVAHAGEVFQVVDPVVAPGGNGIKSEQLVADDYLGCDGRYWYKVVKSDSPGKNSFYPAAFEREFFRVAINENMLKVDATLTLRFDLWTRLLKQTTNAQWVVVVEVATAAQQAAPDPTGPNLENVVWATTPILQQRIILTDNIIRHSFGVQVLRRVDGVLKTNKKIYGTVLAGDYVPPSPNFVLRGRMIEFDTENSIAGLGLAHYHFGKAGNAPVIDPSTDLPTIEITAGAAVAL